MRFYASLGGRVMPPFVYPHHVESEIEIFILVDGDVSFAVESKVYKMKRGDIIVTKPNEMHHCIRNTATANDHYCFHFEPSDEAIFGDFMNHGFGCDNLISPSGEDRELILELAEKINREFSGGGDALRRMALVLTLLDTVKKNAGHSEGWERLPEPLDKILEIIDARLSEEDLLDAVCDEFFVSRSTLGRLFKRYLGTTPHMHLEAKRLAIARRMLEQGVSVSESSRAVGFRSTSSFIRLFKRRFGETPLKYAQK